MTLSKTWHEEGGRLIHDGDCHFWTLKICTCGLLHHIDPEGDWPEWFEGEWGKHARQLERVPEPLVEGEDGLGHCWKSASTSGFSGMVETTIKVCSKCGVADCCLAGHVRCEG